MKNTYRDVCNSVAEAWASAPAALPVGDDNPDTADPCREPTRRVFINDDTVLHHRG